MNSRKKSVNASPFILLTLCVPDSNPVELFVVQLDVFVGVRSAQVVIVSTAVVLPRYHACRWVANQNIKQASQLIMQKCPNDEKCHEAGNIT